MTHKAAARWNRTINIYYYLRLVSEVASGIKKHMELVFDSCFLIIIYFQNHTLCCDCQDEVKFTITPSIFVVF